MLVVSVSIAKTGKIAVFAGSQPKTNTGDVIVKDIVIFPNVAKEKRFVRPNRVTVYYETPNGEIPRNIKTFMSNEMAKNHLANRAATALKILKRDIIARHMDCKPEEVAIKLFVLKKTVEQYIDENNLSVPDVGDCFHIKRCHVNWNS